MEGAPPGSIYGCQENGWINTDLFLVWFDHFIATVNPSIDRKVLLILDGHVSHTQNIQAIVRARDRGVILLSLPPHCTHRLQPFDLTFSKPLSSLYNQCIDAWMRVNPGLGITENKVTQFFGEAYSKAACIATAMSGFKAVLESSRTSPWPRLGLGALVLGLSLALGYILGLSSTLDIKFYASKTSL
jgi:DDE superfamily endonuclease